MDTLEESRPPLGQDETPEYHVFLMDSIHPSPREWRRAGIGSVVVHVVVLTVLLSMPRSAPDDRPEREPLRRVTPLVDPPTRLTQKAPNKHPLSPEITASVEAPPVSVPKPEQRKRFQAPPPAQVAQSHNPVPAVPQEPPKLNPTPTPQTSQIVLPTEVKPPPPSAEPPKLAFEAPPPAFVPGHGTGKLKIPSGGVDEAIQEIAHGGGGGATVGDNTDDSILEAPRNNRSPAPTRPKSSVELLSDPKGVDFRPYLLQVLQSVRQNWFAQMPESARLGIRGRVVVEFYVARDGSITKAVYITRSGSEALDRATIAALSMSNRLPQLPAEFTGERLALRFTFLYNAVR
jgi:TonB family protein